VLIDGLLLPCQAAEEQELVHLNAQERSSVRVAASGAEGQKIRQAIPICDSSAT
jgi:hypothetical protein